MKTFKKKLLTTNVSLICFIILFLIISCITLYKAPIDIFAMIKGVKWQKTFEELSFNNVLFRDTKEILITKIDDKFVCICDGVDNINVSPGRHKIYAHCFMGQPEWRISYNDSVIVDAEAGLTYYLDCSAESMIISDKEPSINYSFMKNSGYLRLYNDSNHSNDKTAQLIWYPDAKIELNSKNIEFWQYIDKDKTMTGVEVKFGKYNLKMTYYLHYKLEKPILMEWNAEPGHIYKFDVISNNNFYLSGTLLKVSASVKDLSQ